MVAALGNKAGRDRNNVEWKGVRQSGRGSGNESDKGRRNERGRRILKVRDRSSRNMRGRGCENDYKAGRGWG